VDPTFYGYATAAFGRKVSAIGEEAEVSSPVAASEKDLRLLAATVSAQCAQFLERGQRCWR
jgi:hypothetical protein